MTEEKQTSEIASLEDQKEKISALAKSYIRLAQEQIGTGSKELSAEAEQYLLSCNWPGGEQELETAVKKACILSEGPQLQVEDFDFSHKKAASIGEFVEARLKGFMRNIKSFEAFNLYEMVIPEVEKALLGMVLRETKGNQIKAANLLGINRNTLRSKIKKLGIKIKT